jgi:long-chain acyl-CoA synthetase
VDFETWVTAAPTDDPAVEVGDDDVAWLIYTSGTTGRPKGVMLTHRNIVTSVMATAIEWSPVHEDVYLFAFPFGHVAGYATLVFHFRGAHVILLRSFTTTDFLTRVEEYGVTVTSLAPTMINFLLQAPELGDRDTSSLRLITYGGSSIPAEVLRRAIEHFGAIFVQGYGMTEAVGNICFLGVDEHRRGAEGEPELLLAAGKAQSPLDLRIVDDHMNDVAVGEVGEIVLRGDQLTKGYWAQPELSEQAYTGGWFHTGDLGRFDADLRVYIVDRKKDMIITGGENVYPREVEEVIYRLASVSEVAVVGLPDEVWGELICAVVAPMEGETVTEDEVVATCRASLAGFKKPKRVVVVDELPKSASGKILKRELRARLQTADTETGTAA